MFTSLVVFSSWMFHDQYTSCFVMDKESVQSLSISYLHPNHGMLDPSKKSAKFSPLNKEEWVGDSFLRESLQQEEESVI